MSQSRQSLGMETPGKEFKKADYAAILKRTGREDLLKKSTIKLIGYQDTINRIKGRYKARENFIVTGPSGVGKTTVVCRTAEGSGLNYMYIDASWLIAKVFGEPETLLNCVFAEAIEKKPSIIFIDDFDHICGSKKSSGGEIKERALAYLKGKLAALKKEPNKVIVVIATCDSEVVDESISKYFDQTIRFPLPNRDDRLKMLEILFKGFFSKELEMVTDATNYYLYDDLKRLNVIANEIDPVKVTIDSVKTALSQYKPKTVQNVVTPCQPLKWDDIGGVKAVKEALQNSVIKPLLKKERFQKFGLGMDKGALLYGPPGCAKNMLAQALATESGYNFISIKGPQLFSKYVGDSEKAVRQLYQNARQIAPCIIFLDEIDGFATERSERDNESSPVNGRVVTQLLTELNEPSDNVFTLAATNLPHRVDMALLRPGRLGLRIYIPLPSKEDRVEIFKVYLRKMPHQFDLDEVAQELASKTDLYSGAEICGICETASRLACLENEENEFVELRHLHDALKTVQPQTSLKQLRSYEKFQEKTLKSGQQVSLAIDPMVELDMKLNDSLKLDQ